MGKIGQVVTHLVTSLKLCMVVGIANAKKSSRDNPKFSAAILDFGGHLGFFDKEKIQNILGVNIGRIYRVIPLFICFRCRRVQKSNYQDDILTF